MLYADSLYQTGQVAFQLFLLGCFKVKGWMLTVTVFYLTLLKNLYDIH